MLIGKSNLILMLETRLIVNSAQKLEQEKKEVVSRPPVKPSGISQLRKASEQVSADSSGNDAMNLDEFIFSENMSTPAGMSASPEMDKKDLTAQKSSVPMAISIKNQKRESLPQFVPQSVPTNQHSTTRSGDEFGYIQRHVRKTSIDERQVCYVCVHCINRNLIISIEQETTGKLLAPSPRHNIANSLWESGHEC